MESAAFAMSKFERAAEAIRADIRSGVFKPGDKLPGTDAIAERYGVARATAQKVLDRLQAERWITKRASVGTFVNEPPAEGPTLEEQVAELQTAMAELTDRVRKIEQHGNA